MAVLSSLLRCLLLGCVLLPGQRLTCADYHQGGSDVNPEEAGLTNLRPANDATAVQVMTVMVEMLRTSVLQTIAEAHGELSAQLGGVQSSFETLSQLTDRMEAVERAVTGLQETSTAASVCQESLQKTMASVASRQVGLQTSLQGIIAQEEALQKTVTAISDGQERVQEALSVLEDKQSNMTNDLSAVRRQLEALTGERQGVQHLPSFVPIRSQLQQLATQRGADDSDVSRALASIFTAQRKVQKAVSEQRGRLDGLAESVAAISDRQGGVERAITGLPTKTHMRQIIDVFFSRLDWTEVLEEITKTQGAALQTLTSHSSQLESVVDALSAVSSQQREVQRALSTQSEVLDGASSALSELSGRQEAAQRTLSAQSAQLAAVAEAVTRTPKPAGQPSLVTGQLLGEPCRSDAECSALRADTVCGGGGRCQCGAGLQPVAGGACRPYPRLTEQCRATSDCRGATKLAVCAESRCGCPRGLFNFNNTECRSGLGIGEPCDRDSDCSTLVGQTCSAGACTLRTCDSPRGGLQRYRLVGGSSCSNGLVQFTFNNGQLWQYVCDSDWSGADAAVTCRYLGFSGGVRLPWNSTAVDEANFLSVKAFVCTGSESSLSHCRRVYGRDSCAAAELARVRCSG